jgi:hypothetical protein
MCTRTISILSVAIFAFLGLLAANVHYASAPVSGDDTFSCLSRSGPFITLSKDFGYTKYKNRSFADGTKFDARGATWKTEQQPNKKNSYPINLGGGSGGCWMGGVVVGTSPLDATWNELYHDVHGGSNSASIIFVKAPNFIIDGIRIHNTWDSLRPAKRSNNFMIRNIWVSRNRDDCVENDQYNAGIIDDSLFDGCFVGLSARGGSDGGGRILVLQNSLMYLQNMGIKQNDKGHIPRNVGHGSFFKWRGKSDFHLALHNNILMAEGPLIEKNFDIPPGSSSSGGYQGAFRLDCSNNIMIWIGDGDYPGTLPSCFKLVKGEEGRKVWDAAKENWINCHPKVARLPGDPASDPSKCDSKAFGAGLVPPISFP